MSRRDFGDLRGDQITIGVGVKEVKLEKDPIGRSLEFAVNNSVLDLRPDSREDRTSSTLSSGQSGTSVLDHEKSPFDDTSICSTSPVSYAPLCRQFWKANKYDEGVAQKSNLRNGTNHLHIHPKFLHSNATSHKWAFGAIAELIDNAIDEIQNGATRVIVDKILIPRNGASALLIQDDGGGMSPEAMRRCLSFGFSNKKSTSAIGQYGNGFKTSSMRLGADVIVFSRHRNRTSTQSIGLLSYTFLTQTGHDRIVVPMVDYELNTSTSTLGYLQSQSKENYICNLSILLQWSPYSTEKELLKQFDDIGNHGTKVIIYNLWFNDESTLELDFESDSEDIRLSGEAKKPGKGPMQISEQHLANRLRYSLRAYLSVLYLRLPASFCMLLRGKVVEYHNIATDLKYPEFILYKPHSGRCVEGEVTTTIGFLKEAPHVNIHGFCVYHKNRLILPFWRIVSFTDSRGRGVVGVLEANFIEPSHNKQDFEKTNVFQKLEVRLKEMTWEYWDYHCGFIGYQIKKKPRESVSSYIASGSSTEQVAKLAREQCKLIGNQVNSQEGKLKRRNCDDLKEPEKVKRKALTKVNAIDSFPCLELEPATDTCKMLEDPEKINILQENRKLRAQCLINERTEVLLNEKASKLRKELREAQTLWKNKLL
ncbi:Protein MICRORCHIDIA like [Heracleum sosnowskyi]|uniref:Protein MICRORCHIDIA like n=1 Tax=Heracleum sosnowskyi TaxID=360622 RepID=A0AAD8MH74_9APIA|nr:Protein MICRORCHIDIA like [Heracleum sosnowskyi]